MSYAGVLASASPWRSRIAPKPPDASPASQPETPKGAGGYRGWPQLLARTFGLDVLACPECQGRLKLMAMVTDPASIARYLAAVGEATQVPRRTPSRGPPYWKSQVLRRRATGDEDGCGKPPTERLSPPAGGRPTDLIWHLNAGRARDAPCRVFRG